MSVLGNLSGRLYGKPMVDLFAVQRLQTTNMQPFYSRSHFIEGRCLPAPIGSLGCVCIFPTSCVPLSHQLDDDVILLLNDTSYPTVTTPGLASRFVVLAGGQAPTAIHGMEFPSAAA